MVKKDKLPPSVCAALAMSSMTQTTSERDRFEAWAKDTMSLVKEPGGYKEATTHHAWRAWQAALTREQREGVCPKCNGDGGERWHEADGSENGQRCEACDGFGTQQEAPGAGCVCGNPEAPYTVHRTDGPCYQQEAQGAVAGWTEAKQRETLVNCLRSSKSWMTGYAEAFVDAFQDHARTTPPAPVDVRVVDAAMLRRALNATFNGVSMYDALQCGTDWNHEILEAALTAALLVGEKP